MSDRWLDNRFLITGGAGFLGSFVVEELRRRGAREIFVPRSQDYDLVRMPDVTRLYADFQPTLVIHLAARVGGIGANRYNPGKFFYENLMMGVQLMEVGRQVGLKKLVALGTICAYPKFCPVPFKEEDIWNGYPEETNAPYGMSKRLQLSLGQTYRQQYGIGGAHLIPVNMYGEHDHFDLTNSHVIPALIRKFDTAIDKGYPTVECWGTGEASREFLYAGDAAEAIVKAVTTGFDSELPINLGTGKDISIKDLASMIGQLTGFKGEIVFNGAVSDGQPKRMLDVSRAKELLGWTADTSFKSGLLRTIEWYRQNKKEIIAADGV